MEFENDGVVARSKRHKKIQKLKKDIDEVDKLQKQELARSFKERSMLRVLSSVGLTIGQFVHEIKYHLDNIRDDIKSLTNDLNGEVQALNRLVILEANFRIL